MSSVQPATTPAPGRMALPGDAPAQPPTEVPEARTPEYFRTLQQTRAWMEDIAARYPDLVELHDVGDSSRKRDGQIGHDILELRVGNRKVPEDKRPMAMWIGGAHAREIANPAMLLRWVERTLEGYGTDPEATAILDTRSISVVPIANPDGYELVEKAYAGERGGSLMQRKNTSDPDGVDLNRNFDWGWGGPGASSSPYSETYRGPSAGSEAEVQALQGLATREKPGIFIDWHSYSKLVLYPWGHTRDKAPDHEGLKAIAERFAGYNRYKPIQSVRLYPTSGTSDAYMYGQLGIPAFGVETGRSFHMSEREFEDVWADNMPVLNYSARIADAPYDRVKGPDALDLYVDSTAGKLTATLSDAMAGGQAIAGAEAVLDPFSRPGSGVALTAADGSWDAPEELAHADLSGLFGALEGEKQLVYVRAQDAQGNWGPASAQWLELPTAR